MMKSKWVSAENGVCIIIIAYALFYTLFSLFGFHLERIPGDLADSRLNNYLLEHGYRFIRGLDESFWSPPFNYPENNMLAYSDNFIGQLPFYATFRFIGLNRENAYQGWLILTYLLNFFCCAWVLFRLGANKPAAFLGAYLFAFSAAILDQSNHTQMTSRYPVALAFYFLIRLFQEPRHRYLLFFLGSVVLQFLNSIYLGFLLSLSLFFFSFVYLILYRKELSFAPLLKKKELLFAGVYLVLSGLILRSFFGPYMRHARAGNFTPAKRDVFESLPRWTSYYPGSPNILSWKFLAGRPDGLVNWWNHWIFPGGIVYASLLTLLIVIVCQLFQRNRAGRSSRIRLAAALFGAMLLLIFFTFRYHNFSLYECIYVIPGFNSMRDLCRVVNIEFFFYAAISALIFTWISEKIRNRFIRTGVMLLLFLVLIVDQRFDMNNVGTYLKSDAIQASSTFVEKVKKHSDYNKYTAIAYIPGEIAPQAIIHLDAMLGSQELGMKTINSYTGTCSSWYCEFAGKHDLVSLKSWLEHAGQPMDSTRILLIR